MHPIFDSETGDNAAICQSTFSPWILLDIYLVQLITRMPTFALMRLYSLYS